MAEGLFDARHKLDRANGHLAELQTLVAGEIADTDSHSVVVEYDSEDRCHYLFTKHATHGHAPSIAGLILGDMVHNARGALDIVAWQLATAKLEREPTESEARRIQFPIAQDAAHFAASSVLEFVSGQAGAEMGRHQPPPGEADHPLALLNWISKRDKHRVIVSGVTSRRLDLRDLSLDPPFTLQSHERLTDAEEIRAVFQRWNPGIGGSILMPRSRIYVAPAVTARNAKFEAKAEFPFDITFRGPTGDFRMPKIEAIYECVEQIVPCFDRFF